MPPSTEAVYESVILPHYEESRHRGTLASPDRSRNERNPVCGDSVRLELTLGDAGARVAQARFQAQGCIISQAAASILCEYVEDKQLGALERLTPNEMLKLLQVPLVPGRLQCALLPFRALRALVCCGPLPPEKQRF